MIDLVNMFGEAGGFQKLLKAMEQQEEPLPLDTVCTYMDIFGKMYALLHRDFALEFIPKVKEAVI